MLPCLPTNASLPTATISRVSTSPRGSSGSSRPTCGARPPPCRAGSEDPATAALREALPLLLQRLGARSLLDAPCGDAGWILCRDCLVHLSFDNIARAVANFRASGARFLLVTTFPEWDGNRDCEDGDWRALNMERAPFNWPAPRERINERCEEGGGWRDKSLGLWRLDQL